jgi:hypothetical protein
MRQELAIHHRPGSFSDAWLAYCKDHGVPFKVVDCRSSDVMEQLASASGLMWHWAHWEPDTMLFAKELTAALEARGMKVFPNSATAAHFDDKLAQKYLFESLGLPAVPTHVFYGREQALEWIARTDFPKVFKLRNGAGAMNVRLVEDKQAARKIVERSFGRGWPAQSPAYALTEALRKLRQKPSVAGVRNVALGILRSTRAVFAPRLRSREQGYVYFQDFIKDNDSDVRVTVIGTKAFGFRRMTRRNDFRASGSGNIRYEPREIPLACVAAAFDATQKMRSQCAAFDFVFLDGKPLIVEVSYGFSSKAAAPCPGYWDVDLRWHEAPISAGSMIIESFIGEIATAA